jgi:hypothetical protein
MWESRSLLLRNVFSTNLALGSTANPKLAFQAQTVGFADVTLTKSCLKNTLSPPFE